MKIAIANNTSHYAWMFRSNLITKLIENGHVVTVIAPFDSYANKIEALSAKYVHLSMKMNKNPFSDLLLVAKFHNILKREDIEIYLGYTIKPNIYGSLAAQALGIPTINNITGLGATFIKNGLITRLVKFLYRMALKRSAKVFFQNNDDLSLFINENIIFHKRYDLLPGSGIDLVKYTPLFGHNNGGSLNIKFLLVARMLWDKGIGEYVNAARILKAKNKHLIFLLLGPLDVQNPAAISREKVLEWQNEGIIKYLGVSEDTRKEISMADCVVLPSYREGTSRALLEAAAMGKPIITTNAVGCKEVVDHEINGFLCNVRDSEDLADKMLRMAEISPAQRDQMGINSRKKVEIQFDEDIVLNKYMNDIAAVTID